MIKINSAPPVQQNTFEIAGGQASGARLHQDAYPRGAAGQGERRHARQTKIDGRRRGGPPHELACDGAGRPPAPAESEQDRAAADQQRWPRADLSV
jgi:hypothetical protein